MTGTQGAPWRSLSCFPLRPALHRCLASLEKKVQGGWGGHHLRLQTRWSSSQENMISRTHRHTQLINISGNNVSTYSQRHFPRSSEGKESAHSAGDPGSIPGSGSSPGVGNGTPLQYSCLENPTDRGAWRAAIYGVARVRHA